ncbi:MAG: tyrosine-type recombinase/integrase [Planctomycetota bacterium]|jgi:hypothetical protein
MSNVEVKLWKQKRKMASGKLVHYWQLVWKDTSGKKQTKTLGKCSEITATEAKAARRDHELKINTGEARRDRGERLRLDEFRIYYQQRRTRYTEKASRLHKTHQKISPGTAVEHDMTARYLIQHFGPEKLLDTITAVDADDFLTALAAGKLEAARIQTSREYELTENALRKHCRHAKAIFGWARAMGLIIANPFGDFAAPSLPGPPKAQISREDFRTLIAPATQPWRAFLALCRLAGLRREEARTLPWSGQATDKFGQEHWVGVDFEAEHTRISLVSAKTGHHRVVPVDKELEAILTATFDAAPAGSNRVAHPITRNNLTRKAQELITAAGLKSWPKFYNALRASRENEWKEGGFAEATYAAWMGHGIGISRTNYVCPTEAEFARATGKAA